MWKSVLVAATLMGLVTTGVSQAANIELVYKEDFVGFDPDGQSGPLIASDGYSGYRSSYSTIYFGPKESTVSGARVFDGHSFERDWNLVRAEFLIHDYDHLNNGLPTSVNFEIFDGSKARVHSEVISGSDLSFSQQTISEYNYFYDGRRSPRTEYFSDAPVRVMTLDLPSLFVSEGYFYVSVFSDDLRLMASHTRQRDGNGDGFVSSKINNYPSCYYPCRPNSNYHTRFDLQMQLFGTEPISAVPVPAALPLLASAFAGFGFLSWWKRRKAVS